jgi:hypothetical protein
LTVIEIRAMRVPPGVEAGNSLLQKSVRYINHENTKGTKVHEEENDRVRVFTPVLSLSKDEQGGGVATFSGYTSKRRPVTLAFAELSDSRDEAFRRERQIKGWSRAKKEALMKGDWEAVRRLSRTAHPSTGSG